VTDRKKWQGGQTNPLHPSLEGSQEKNKSPKGGVQQGWEPAKLGDRQPGQSNPSRGWEKKNRQSDQKKKKNPGHKIVKEMKRVLVGSKESQKKGAVGAEETCGGKILKRCG